MRERPVESSRMISPYAISKWAVRGEIAGGAILLMGTSRGEIIDIAIGGGLLGVSVLADGALIVHDRLKGRRKHGTS